MKKLMITIIVIIFLPLNISLSQNIDSLKNEVLNAIIDGANYSCDVLLDVEGKSKCDYNMMEGKWYPYEPAWHTGQIIFGLVEAYKITKNEKFLTNAKRAGDWWTGLEIKEPQKLKGMLRAIHGDGIENIVFATISDGSNGLFELWRVTNETKYASIPTKAGEWMLSNMYIPEYRIFYDNVDPNTGEVLKERSPFWSNKKEQKLFDVARPNNEGYLFKDMFEYTKNEKYKKLFIELCESLLEKQGPEDVWMDFTPNNKEDGSFHPRFSLWYAESLVEGFKLTGDRRYLLAAKKTAEVFAKIQDKEGVIYYTNYSDGKKNQNSICGSATSFAGILWLKLIEAGVGEEFKKNVERSLNFILKSRYSKDHSDKNLAGGFFETRMRIKNNKVWFTARQDIATSFGIRFLSNYYKLKYHD